MRVIDTSSWAKCDGWRIAPDGLDWIDPGSRIICADGVRIADGASIGSYARIGNDARIGSYASIGNGASIGSYARIVADAIIGSYASIGNDAIIGSYASIGNGASIGSYASVGPRSSDAVDIGWADGYRKCIAQVDGVAYIGAGCRWFTLAEALKHWDNKPDRVLTMCLMRTAIAIAQSKGWSHG